MPNGGILRLLWESAGVTGNQPEHMSPVAMPCREGRARQAYEATAKIICNLYKSKRSLHLLPKPVSVVNS